jgi:uncharacterized protein YjbI with pentapeptide repeats
MSGADPEVWAKLLGGGSLDALGLPTVDGRIDLRGLRSPEPTIAGEITTPIRARVMKNLVEVRGATWRGLDFSGSSLEHLRIFDSVIEDCVFDDASCRGSRMWSSAISNTRFCNTDMRDFALGGLDQQGKWNSYRHVDFTRADLRGSAWKSAEVTDCTFADTDLSKVEFEGTRFTRCTFAGLVRETIFYRHAFKGEDLPSNEMRDVDFRGAQLRDVEFRKLDLDTVQWPDDDDHVVIDDYPAALDRAIAVFRTRNDQTSRVFTAVLELKRKWVGARQRRGILNRLDWLDRRDPAAVDELVAVLRGGN